MPPSLVTCSGCSRSFLKFRGFRSHLRQSTKRECQAVLRQLQRRNQAETDSSSENLSDNLSDNDLTDCPWSDDLSPVHDGVHHNPVPFPGDAFGSAQDYDNDFEMFGQDNESTHSGGMEDPEDGGTEDPEDDDTEASRRVDVDLEDGWEPRRLPEADTSPAHLGNDDEDDNLLDEEAVIEAYRKASQRADEHPRIVKYSSQHSSTPGSVLRYDTPQDVRYAQQISQSTPGDGNSNKWAPFASEIDWKIAKWAKLRGAGSTAFSDLLAIDGIRDALGLSYKNSQELNALIDSALPKRPEFKRHEVVVANESFELYARNVVECIKALWADPDFLPYLVFEPEEHYADDAHTVRMYHDMHTGRWWWSTQEEVERVTKKKNITIVPIIISSDKTQLTTFRNKTAYPLYMTIGNLPKNIRRKPSRQGQILLAYLPTSSLKHISNKSARRRAVANLFHACVKFVLSPLEKLGKTGLHLVSGDGAVRDCHPILAAHIGDYPEQVLATCTKSGQCPICSIPRESIGDPSLTSGPRDIDAILEALEVLDYSDPAHFNRACKSVGIKPIQHPYWQDLPFVNIYRSITPDLLHQLYQGNIKHLIGWLQKACGEAEIDARCRRLPPNHNVRLFLKGISHLSRITGTEHDQMCRFLLGLIVGVKLPGNRSAARLVRATRAMLDFLYLAKFPIHTTETLSLLQRALDQYHDNRDIFIDLGIRNDFNFPKDHFINHYRELIELFGTADNFNTEYTERLHIDFAKDAYRSTNCKDEYSQMTAWLDRRERVQHHDKFLARQASCKDNSLIPRAPAPPPRQPPLVYPRQMKTASQPSAFGVSLRDIEIDYQASDFRGAFARFVVGIRQPELSTASSRQLEQAASKLRIPFHKISVFHRIKFITKDPFSLTPDAEIVVDSIHCEPGYKDKNGKQVPGRFDTALIDISSDMRNRRPGIKGFCVGQVRLVFDIPKSAFSVLFPESVRESVPSRLAYVEWFTPFSDVQPGRDHRMFKISRRKTNGKQRASIVPIHLVQQSVHLFPVFGAVAPAEWKSSNVLNEASDFFVNPFSDRFQYSTLL